MSKLTAVHESLSVSVFQCTAAIRSKNFAEFFVGQWSPHFPDQYELLIEIGDTLERMFAVANGSKSQYRKAAKSLRGQIKRLIGNTLASKSRHTRETGRFFINWLHDLINDFEDAAKPWSGNFDAKIAKAWGAALWCAEQQHAAGAPVNVEAIAEIVSQAFSKDGVSVTDVKTSVKLFTGDIPLERWLSLPVSATLHETWDADDAPATPPKQPTSGPRPPLRRQVSGHGVKIR